MRRALTLLFFLLGLLSGCVAQTFKIVTPTMAPAIKVGEIRKAAKIGDDYIIRRFDIVVFPLPEEIRTVSGDAPGAKIICRIIGMPSEKVEIKNGEVFINDQPLTASFAVIPDKMNVSATIVPENEYYVLGDNRPESLDSRHWKKKTITRSEISGKIEDIE
jgi:signal peptidase I